MTQPTAKPRALPLKTTSLKSASPRVVTRSTEDYLKSIFAFAEEHSPTLETSKRGATTNDLAVALNVSPPAISKMLKQLQQQKLVLHAPYHGVKLTANGRRIALRIVRRHRLLERYLYEQLGYKLDEVHAEAEQLEHHVSDDFIRRISERMKDAATCPHGSPIPSGDGTLAKVEGQPLTEYGPPARVRITQLNTEDAEALRFIEQEALLPKTELTILKREPLGGDLQVRAAKRTLQVSQQVARLIIAAEI